MTDRAAFLDHITATLQGIEAEGLMKRERLITGPQGAHVAMAGREMLNLCANNYLGLADDPRLIAAAKQAMDDHGFGMASVRFICGTQDLHRKLEARLADYLGQDDSILFAACFDANGGLFEPLARAGGCGDLGRAEPRQHHRRHPPVQGQALSLCQQRHGRP